MSTIPVLKLEDVCLTSKQVPLFENISLQLFPGEMLAVMGPSGIGKSMLAKVVAGMLPPDINAKGVVEVNGQNVTDKSIIRRDPQQRPAVIFQDALTALNPLATVEQQLALALTNRKTRLSFGDRTLVISLLVKLGFEDPAKLLSNYPSQLSGGQRQRICIAMALLGKANLVIADEPTSALDPITEQEILSLLHGVIKQKSASGILITHDLPTALNCDKVVVIADGSMVAYGEPHSAIHQSEHDFCKQLAKLVR